MKVLIYDLETAPNLAYVWSAWKQNVAPNQVVDHGRVICWAAKWLGDKDKDIMFGAEWEPTARYFIARLHDLMDEADAIITYNGNRFDEPVMNTAFAFEELPPPPPRKSIDLYQVVRKEFRLLHNRMDSVAEFLNIKGKLSTGGFDLWVGVENGDPKAQEKMKKYNIQDIKVLEKIYMRLRPWIKNHPAMSHYNETGDHSCPTCGSKKLQRRGTHKTKVSTFRRYQCTSCGGWSRQRLAEKETVKPEIVKI